jgi:hypothetical protein
MLVGYEPQPGRFRLSHNELWNLPARFDAGWYLGIARRGYRYDPALRERQQNIAFFPAFPLAMRVAGEVVTVPAHVTSNPDLFGNGNTRVVWGGALLSIACFVCACALLVRLASVRLAGADTGFTAVLLMATYPFALLYSAPYSEALLLLSAVAAFLQLELRRPWRAAAWAFLAGLSRSNGWTLTAGLLAFVIASRALRRSPAAWVAAIAPAAAMLAFSAYVWRLSGEPFAWIRAQQAWGRSLDPFGFIVHRARTIQENGLAEYLRSDVVGAATFVAVLLMLIGAIIAWRRVGAGYALFAIAYITPAVLIDLPSTGRMTSVLFPSFLALATILTRAQALAIGLVFFAGQLWFAARFFTWQTPY